VRARDRLEIDEQTPTLLSKIIISSWDANPKSRPDFAKIAKQLESDIIMLQVNLPTVFVAATASTNILKAPQDDLNSNLGEVLFFETQPQAVTKVQTLEPAPIVADPVVLTNTGIRPLEQKKPLNFLSVYTKRKKLLVLAAFLIALTILAVVVTILAVFLNPQQKNTSDTSATELTVTSRDIAHFQCR
jgi:hypothetical protein